MSSRPQRPRRRAPRRVLVSLAVLLAVLTLAAPALAATPLDSLDVRLIADAGEGKPLLLVGGTLPEATSLPAELSLPVPAGSEIVWAGEILGGSAENDTQLEPRITHGDPYDTVILTLKTSHQGQVEVSAPGLVSGDATGRKARVVYDAPEAAQRARVAVAVPRGSRVASTTPGAATATPGDGSTYYYFERDGLAKGDVLELAVSYVPGAAPAVSQTPARAGGGGGAVLPVLVLGLAVGVPAFALLIRRTKRQAEASGGDDGAETGTVAAEEDDAPEPAAIADEDPALEDALSAEDVAPDDITVGPSEAAAAAGRRGPWRLVVMLAAVAFVAAFLYAAVGGSEPAVGVLRSGNGVFSQRISKAEASSSARFQVTIPCECPPEKEAPKMFAALATLPGVADASLQSSTMVMEVAFDASLVDAQAISAALASANYSPRPAP